MNSSNNRVATRKRAAGSSLQSKLLMSAAASALLFAAATPAQAACSISTTTITCTAGPGSALDDAGIGAATLDPSLTMNVNSGATVNASPFTFNHGTTPGPFVLNVAQATGDTTTVAGTITAFGDPTLAGNTAVVNNLGALNGGLYLGATAYYQPNNGFGGLITVTNSGTISWLQVTSATGNTVTNAAGGTIGTVILDTVFLNDVVTVTPRTYDGTTKMSTDGVTTTFSNLGGTESFTNAGAVTNDVNIWGTDSTFTNSGTVGGDSFVSSLDSYGPDTSTVFTRTYLDATNTGTVDDTNKNMAPFTFTSIYGPTAVVPLGADSYQSTTTTTETPWGGSAKVTNSGELNNLDVYAAKTITFSNTGKADGYVNLSTFDDQNTVDVISVVATDDGTTEAYKVTDTYTAKQTGGSVTADNAKGAEIDGLFTANSATDVTVTNEGLFKDNVGLATDVGTEHDTYIENWVNNGTTESFATSDAYTYTPTGGKISLTNAATGEIDGMLSADATGNSTVVNGGLIKGNVTIFSNQESEDWTDVTTNVKSVAAPTFTTKVVTDPAVPPNTTTTTNDWTSSLFHSDSEDTSDTYTSVGGTASLTNQAGATIGTDAKAPVFVVVNGDTAATATNDGTILGNLSVISTPDPYTKIEGNSNTYVDEFGTGADYTRHQVDVVTNDGTNPAFTSSDSDVAVYNYAESHTTYKGETTVYGAGSAAVANTGDISGNVNSVSSGAATLVNSGTVGGDVSVQSTEMNDTWLQTDQDSSGTPGYAETYKVDNEYTAAYSGTDFLENTSKTTNDDTLYSYENVYTDAAETIGGTALLTNEADGAIGTKAAPVFVDVDGQASAGVINDGTIYGGVHVGAAEFSTNTLDSAKANWEVVDTTSATTDAVNALAMTTTDDSSTSNIGSYASENAYTETYTGGDASLSNSSSTSIHGDVEVDGVATAAIDNTGLITGNVTAAAAATNLDEATVIDASWDLFTSDNNMTVNTYDKTSTLTAATDTRDQIWKGTGSATLSKTYTESSAGGNATLTNSATGVIGASAAPVVVNVGSSTASTATVDNAGTIYGDVNVGAETWDYSKTLDITASGTGELERVNVVTHDYGTTPYDPSDKTTITGSLDAKISITQTETDNVTGGVASLTNSSPDTITGNVYVDGAGGATLDNIGGIGGSATVLSGDWSSGSVQQNDIALSGTLADATDTEVTIDSGTTTTVATDKGSLDIMIDRSTDKSGYKTIVGADSTLMNEVGAKLGTPGDGTTVWVAGVGSSLVNNAGGIYSDVAIGADDMPRNRTWTNSDVIETTISGTRNNSQTTVDDGKTITVTYDNAKTLSVAKTETETGEWTSTDVLGPATYTGSGDLFGSLKVGSVDDASITNSGTIGNALGGGYVTVASHGNARSGDYTRTTTATLDLIDEAVTTDGLTETDTGTLHTTSSDTVARNYSRTAIGGMATLLNNGVIGGDSTNPIFVGVFGEAGASLINHSRINGNVEVVSTASNYTSSYTDATTEDTLTDYVITTDLVKSKSSVVSTTTDVVTEAGERDTDYALVGGTAGAVNTSALTITGDLMVAGDAGSSVANMGSIWGNVTIGWDPIDNETTKEIWSSTDTTVTKVNGINVTSTETFSSKDEFADTSVDIQSDSTLSNTGTIGLRLNDLTGHTYIYDANFDSNPDGNVDLFASANVSVNNSATGVIFGNVTGTAEGQTEVSDEIWTEDSTTVTTISKAGKDVAFDGTKTDTYTWTETATGGTATLVNNGKIGQRFADATAAGTWPNDVTAPGGVYLYGDAGATITNNNLIGGDAQATSHAWNGTDNYTETDTLVSLDSHVNADDTQTFTKDTAETWTYTPAGGMAQITNNATGRIGPDILDSIGRPRGANATIGAWGDSGAAIDNAGLMQASLITAGSHSDNETFTETHTYTETDAGVGLPFVSSTETYSYKEVYQATGGTAVITNTGRMLGSGPDGGYSSGSGLDVVATGFGGASVLNMAGALIDGSVAARSFDYDHVYTEDWTEEDAALAGTDPLVFRTDTVTHTDTYGGAAALVDNFSKITGNVEADGYESGLVLNRAGATIGGSASAFSAYQNYDFSATTNWYGITATPGEDTYNETYTWVGGDAMVHNLGAIAGTAAADGFTTATVINDVGASIGSGVYANSLYFDQQLNDVGIVSETAVGGTASVGNYGTVVNGFSIQSYAGSSLFNVPNAAIDTSGGNYSYMGVYSPAATNLFTNAGTIGTPPILGNLGLWFGGLTGLNLSALSTIEFQGNTSALNTGIIAGNLVFTNGAGTVDAGSTPGADAYTMGGLGGSSSIPSTGTSTATYTFGKGSVLTGCINCSTAVALASGTTLANLTLNFTDSGLYQGNVYGATTTNKTGPGTWILTGSRLGLGTTTISAGTLQIGTPLNYFLDNPSALIELALGSQWDALEGLNPWLGNTALNPALEGQTVSSSLISALSTAPIITGNVTVGASGSLISDAIYLGNLTNNGTYLAGYVLPTNANMPLGNLLDNTNQVLPGHDEISGNFVQSSTGTMVTNFAATINRPERVLQGTQSELFANTNYWLDVAPFAPDNTPSTMVTVNGTANVAGRVLVYVNKSGLYVDGDSHDILTSVGTLTSTATTAQSAPSLFVGFGLHTRVSNGLNVLSVTVDRTSYASVAGSTNQTSLGTALDSAVDDVANRITANNFASVADFTAAQDLAGFLSDMDWQVTSQAQAAAILSDVSPDAWASLPSIDTGAGFRSQLTRHLTEQRGNVAAADPAFGAWIQAYGISQHIEGNHGIAGLTASTTGVSLGWDTQIDNFVVGLAGGYSQTSLGGHDAPFGGQLTSYQGGAYASANFDQLYVDATVWGNFGNGHVDRRLQTVGRTGTASVKPQSLRVDAEAGYRFQLEEQIGVTPYLGISYWRSDYGHISEAGLGGLGFNLSNVKGSYFTPVLGVTADGTWKVSDSVTVKPLAGIGLEFQDKPDAITAQFQGGGDPFAVRSSLRNGVAFKPEAGVNILVGQDNWMPNVSFQIGYMGKMGTGQTVNGGWIGFRANW